jgi:hypothetical protein
VRQRPDRLGVVLHGVGDVRPDRHQTSLSRSFRISPY